MFLRISLFAVVFSSSQEALCSQPESYQELREMHLNRRRELNYRMPVERREPFLEINPEITIRVSEFGAKPDDNKDDLPAIRNALIKIEESGLPAELVFEEGTYTLDVPEDEKYAFSLSELKNILISGNGAEFVVTNPLAGFMRLMDSDKVLFRGFSLDYDPLPFSQGDVIEVDEEGFIEVRLHKGFPSLDSKVFRSNKRFALIKSKGGGGAQKAGLRNVFPVKPGWNEVKPGVFKIKWLADHKKGITPGDIYVHVLSTRPICSIKSSTDITFQNSVIYSGPGICFGGSNGGNLALLNHRTLIRKGRYLANSRDFLNMPNQRPGPWIENCIIEGQGDDGVNIHGKAGKVQSVKRDNTLMVVPIKNHLDVNVMPPISAGDRIAVYDGEVNKEVFTANVISCRKGNGRKVTVKLDKNPGDLKVHEKLICYNLSALGSGFVIKNNTFRFQRRYGILVQSTDGIIAGNVFEQTSANAVVLAMETHFRVGYIPSRIEIENNIFYGCFRQFPESTSLLDHHLGVIGSSISPSFYWKETAESVEPDKVKGDQMKDIKITGNTFVNQSDVPYFGMHNCEELVLDDNAFYRQGKDGRLVRDDSR